MLKYNVVKNFFRPIKSSHPLKKQSESFHQHNFFKLRKKNLSPLPARAKIVIMFLGNQSQKTHPGVRGESISGRKGIGWWGGGVVGWSPPGRGKGGEGATCSLAFSYFN